MPLATEGSGYRVFAFQAPEKNLNSFSESSHGLRLLFRGRPSTEPLHQETGFPETRQSVQPTATSATPPLRFQTPTARSHSEQRHERRRLSKANSPTPTGDHNLLAFSSAPSLPALFHAGSALGVNPAKLCSSTAAARHFWRRSPHSVLNAFRVLLRVGVRHSMKRIRPTSSA